MPDTQRRKQNITRALVMLFFLALSVFMASVHESWRDELQAWNMAKLLSPDELLAHMKYEGHPALWHFILMPFAKAGLPCEFISYISIAFMAAAALFLLRRAPLHTALKLTVIFSAAFIYDYGVIARSYSLIPLLVFLLADIYPYRAQKPLRYGLVLAILVQTHVIMVFFAGILSIFFTVEAFFGFAKDKDRKSLFRKGAGLCLPLLSLILFIAQIAGAEQSSAFDLKSLSPAQIFQGLSELYRRYWIIHFPTAHLLNLGCALGGLACIALAVLLLLRQKDREDIKALCIALLSILAQLFFSMLVYGYNGQRYFTWLFIWLWLLWVTWPKGKPRLSHLALICFFLLLSLPGFIGWGEAAKDIGMDYSGGKACAEYINENVPKDALLIQCDSTGFAAVYPHLDEGYTVYSSESGEVENFKVWRERSALMADMDAVKAWALEKDPDCGEFWLMLSNAGEPTAASEAISYWCWQNFRDTVVFSNYELCLSSDEYTVCRIKM